MIKIDLKDRKILKELDMDANMPLSKLAKRVQLSRQVVEYRIKKLFEKKVIFGATGVFDSEVANYEWYRIIIRLINTDKNQKEELIEYFKKHKYTMWLGEVGGNWDIVVNFICIDNFKFNTLFEKLITKFGNIIKDYEILVYLEVYDLQRKYLLNELGDRKEFYHEMKLNENLKLDDLDKAIIKEYTKENIPSNLELGKKLKVSDNTIKNRINEMKKNKLFLGFRLFINPSVLGYKSNMLFLETTKLDLNREQELFKYAKTNPNITFIVKQIGRWRIGLEIETSNDEQFQEIFVEIRGKFSDIITNYESFPLLRDHKINYFPEGNLE